MSYFYLTVLMLYELLNKLSSQRKLNHLSLRDIVVLNRC